MNKIVFILALIIAVSAGALQNVLRFEAKRQPKEPRKTTVNVQAFKYRDCGGKDVKVLTAIETPDPLKIPGNINVSISANFVQGFDSPLPASLLIKKKVGSKFVKLPCIDMFGSCDYEDLCDLLGQIGDCPDAVTKAGLKCQCPFKTGTFNVKGASFEIDFSSTLLTGDYMIRGNVSSKGVLAGCIEVNFTVVQSDAEISNRWSRPFNMN